MEISKPIKRTELRSSRRFGRMLEFLFEYIRVHAKALGKALLLIAGPPILIGSAVLGMSLAPLFSFGLGEGAELGFESITMMILAAVAVSIGSFIVYSVVTTYVRLSDERMGEPVTPVADVIAGMRKDAGKTITTFFGFILIGVVYVGSIVLLWRETGIYLTAVLAVLTIPVVFYFSVAWSLALQVRVVERGTFLGSVQRSTTLIKGNWWPTFGLITMMSVIQSILRYAFSLPLYILQMMSIFTENESYVAEDTGLLYGIAIAISMCGSMLLSALVVLVPALQYYNMVERHEGIGLLGRIESIGVVSEGGAPSGGSNAESW